MVEKIKLNDAYSLKTPEDSVNLYKKWAEFTMKILLLALIISLQK